MGLTPAYLQDWETYLKILPTLLRLIIFMDPLESSHIRHNSPTVPIKRPVPVTSYYIQGEI
jgi:hypothetical protein